MSFPSASLSRRPHTTGNRAHPSRKFGSLRSFDGPADRDSGLESWRSWRWVQGCAVRQAIPGRGPGPGGSAGGLREGFSVAADLLAVYQQAARASMYLGGRRRPRTPSCGAGSSPSRSPRVATSSPATGLAEARRGAARLAGLAEARTRHSHFAESAKKAPCASRLVRLCEWGSICGVGIPRSGGRMIAHRASRLVRLSEWGSLCGVGIPRSGGRIAPRASCASATSHYSK